MRFPVAPKCALLLAVVAHIAFCQISRAAEAEPAPVEVTIGVLVNRIDAISLKESTFDVDFYLWFVWSDAAVNPGDSFEIVNGRINSKVDSDIHPVEGGQYACYRIQATIIKEFDLFKYPRDKHSLSIEIEDGASVERLVYKLDSHNSKLNRDFFVPGFTADNAAFAVADHTYDTNYGDPDLGFDSESVFSRFFATFAIHRPSDAAALKLYIGVLVAALIGFVSLLTHATQVEVRFGLGSAALFAAIATQFVIATNMPETSMLTVPDLVCITTIASVFLTLLESAVALNLCNAGKIETARKLDLVAFAILPATYFVLCFWWILS